MENSFQNFFPTETLDITALHREPAHSPWRAYQNEAQARENAPSPNITSLNGDWLFKLYPNPAVTPPFYTLSHPRAGFTPIPVPSNWELYGHHEPRYTNIIYPWRYEGDAVIKPAANAPVVPNPPHMPQDNPCGCYYREFDLAGTNQEVFIRFDAVETAYKLWINGEFAGYSEDSKLPSAFNITKYVKPGVNAVAVQVARFTKATYLEDQDYWHLSGIFGDVSLIRKQAAHIADYQVTAIPHLQGAYGTADTGLVALQSKHHGFQSCSPMHPGVLSADVKISAVPMYADYTVKLSLYNHSGDCLGAAEAKPAVSAIQNPKAAPTARTARLGFTVPNITPWTTETPTLYRLVISLISPAGEVTDVEACHVGFKKLEIKNGIVYLNEQRLVIKGVNRHQHHFQTGRVVPREWMRREIIEMKRMNINAVRTSHYPCSQAWYELCDELGILVVCEANIETHGVSGQLSQNPAWASLFLERAVRMAQTFKNHVSIYAWSLGNESGSGPNHGAMAGFLREYDPTRLCQYEDGAPSALVSDVRGVMYAPIQQIFDMLTDPVDTRPIILVEYLYQIRNAGGGLYKFRELTEKYPRFQGGFVWDWQDKTLEGRLENGETFFAYGGDMGEALVEHTQPPYMTNNGIVLPNLRWKPVAYELKQAYAPVVVRPVDKIRPWIPYNAAAGQYEVLNLAYTKPISDFDITMVLLEDGKTVHEAPVHCDVAPLSKAVVDIAPGYPLESDREYFIEFRVTEKSATFYAGAGYEVGRFQYLLKGADAVRRPMYAAFAGVREYADKETFVLETKGVKLVYWKETKTLTLEKDGAVYLLSIGVPALDRPFTGMDTFDGWGGMVNVFALMRDGNTTAEICDATLTDTKTLWVNYKISTKVEAPTPRTLVSYATFSYGLFSSGELDVAMTLLLNPDLAYVPRAGVVFTLPGGFEKLTYYGLGDNDNYSDRQMSATMAVHESTVTDQHFPFNPPSVSGGHGQTRWVTLENEDGRKVTFTGYSPFHFQALHHAVADYQQARHDHELPKREETFLHIDAAHSGIGSNMAWSSHLDPAHLVPAAPYHLRFTIMVE